MKNFKKFLFETAKKDPSPEELAWGKQATYIQLGREFFDGTNLTADNALMVGGLYMTPPNKQRIKTEKAYNTDIGIAYDTDENGELVANPAGFKAVHQREKEGRSYPTAFPPTTLQQAHNEFIDRGIKATSDLLDPETYKKLGKIIYDTFSYSGPSTEEIQAKQRQLQQKNYNQRFGQIPINPNN